MSTEELDPETGDTEVPSAAPEGEVSRWLPSGDEGMATAEYAIVTLAAAGFAGLLAVILRSPEIREAISAIIRSALSG
ncbi:MAG: DUF4244 domain-containing protein [Actinomycetales bacterium]|nr:DUF4244 domain-containing protein [Actinomycetales bacterium]